MALITLFSPPSEWYLESHPASLYDKVVQDVNEGTPTKMKDVEFPEFTASFFSRLMFNWVTPMITQGYKEPLKNDDIWKLAPADKTTKLLADFEREWSSSKKVLGTLWRLHKREFIISAFWKILNDASQFVGPVFLDALLTSEGSVGYIYAAGIFLGLALGLLGENQFFQIMMRVGFQTRAALVAKLFKHAVYLSHTGKANSEGIEINNLISSDCEALQNVCSSLHNAWSAPVRIVVAMALLYKQLGPSALTAFVVLCVFIPLMKACIKRIAMAKRKAAKHTDSRVRLMGEIIDFMHVIKCYAWEESTDKVLSGHRQNELETQYEAQCWGAINGTVTSAIPVFVSVLTFTMFSIGNTLTPSKAFTSLALFGVLRMPLFTFPNLVTQLASCQVSLQRIEKYLLTEERSLNDFPPQIANQPAIEIKNGCFSWNTNSADHTLSNIELSINPGELVAVVGSAGYGKSSLLEALLGEMPAVNTGSGFKHSILGRVAYVPQQSWIFNATVQDNITFGIDYDHDRFMHAVQVSQLGRDLEILSDGQNTEIGERGVNVSGGQKQRISIARAVYADADVYIFDDPLSALDASVGKRVFDECINGWLGADEATGRKAKTRVLATNQLQYCNDTCDNILFLGQGCIEERGNFEKHKKDNSAFYNLYMNNVGGDEDEEDDDEKEASEEVPEVEEEKKIEQSFSDPQKDKEDGKAKKLIAAESRETGSISFGVISRYAEALGGWCLMSTILVFYAVVEGTRTGASLWMTFWSGHPHEMDTWGFLGIYAASSLFQVALGMGQAYFIATRSNYAARVLHSGMLSAVFRAPMSFFHTNSKGRIINRFSKDQADIDSNIAMYTNVFLKGIIQLTSTLVLISVTTPFVMTCIVPLLVVFWFIYRLFQVFICLCACTQLTQHTNYTECIHDTDM